MTGSLRAVVLVEPAGVGHGGAGGEHADPGAVGGFGEEDGDAEAAGEDGETGDVVLMLVGDEDGVECGWGLRRRGAMRRRSSRQERPASTRTRVRALAMTVEFPLEPEARTVMRMG